MPQMNPTEYNPEMARQAAVKELMGKSGDFVDTSDGFKIHLAVNEGLLNIGFDRSAMIHIFRRYAWQSADKGRRKETNMMQLLMPPAINVLPTAGTLGEKEEDKMSLIGKFIAFARGTKGEEKT